MFTMNFKLLWQDGPAGLRLQEKIEGNDLEEMQTAQAAQTEDASQWIFILLQGIAKRLFAATVALISVSIGWFIMWKLVLQDIPFIRDLVQNRPTDNSRSPSLNDKEEPEPNAASEHAKQS